MRPKGHKGAGGPDQAGPAKCMGDMINDMKSKGLLQKPKLGSGARFQQLESKLSKRPGVTDPAGLAAYIGRKKYGAKKFASLAAKGK